MAKERRRCSWVSEDQIYMDYHDNEWGVPVHDDRKLFEAIVLDTFQAGLSWFIILKKREKMRKAFDNFDANKIAKYDERKVKALLNNEGIIRNRLKIMAAIHNARMFLGVQKEFGSFDRYMWQFTDYKIIVNRRKNVNQLPARTKESDAMSIDMKRRGFKFTGSTICYAFMQAVGMVNDHTIDCFRYRK